MPSLAGAFASFDGDPYERHPEGLATVITGDGVFDVYFDDYPGILGHFRVGQDFPHSRVMASMELYPWGWGWGTQLTLTSSLSRAPLALVWSRPDKPETQEPFEINYVAQEPCAPDACRQIAPLAIRVRAMNGDRITVPVNQARRVDQFLVANGASFTTVKDTYSCSDLPAGAHSGAIVWP